MAYSGVMEGGTVDLRERTRRAVRDELVTVALDLFLSQGYEPTTVDQIAAAAGLSRRSFFRYFAGKDDILAQTLAALGEQIAATLRTRPTAETLWTALRHSFSPLIDHMTSDPRSLAMTRLMLESPALHASHLQKHADWQASIGAAVIERLPTVLPLEDRRLRADALSGAALAALMSAQVVWVARGGRRRLDQLLDVAMEAVSPL